MDSTLQSADASSFPTTAIAGEVVTVVYVQCCAMLWGCMWPHAKTSDMPDRGTACLQVIEFESSPLLMVGHALGLRVSLIAYPVISIKKVRLETLVLLRSAESSDGVLTLHLLAQP